MDAEENQPSDPSPESTGSPVSKSFGGAAGDLLKRMLGPTADEIGRDLALKYRAWRWRAENVEAIAEKVSEECSEQNLSPDEQIPIPEGDAFRALEACSLEDDQTVQTLWAGLFANAMNPNSNARVDKSFVEILKSLNGAEAGLLLVIRKAEVPVVRPPSNLQSKPTEEIHQVHAEIVAKQQAAKDELSQFAERFWRRHPQDVRENAVQNLMRLRCIGHRATKNLKERDLARRPIGAGSGPFPADSQVVARVVDYLENLALASTGTVNISRSRRDQSHNPFPELEYDFTPLGRSLIKACVEDIDRIAAKLEPE